MKYIISSLLIFFSGSVHASCWIAFLDNELARQKGVPVINIEVDKSDFIFTGKVIMADRTLTKFSDGEEYISRTKAIIEIDEVLKSTKSDKVAIYSGGECGCKYVFEPGIDYIVFANYRNERYETYRCKNIEPLQSADIDLLRELVRINN